MKRNYFLYFLIVFLLIISCSQSDKDQKPLITVSILPQKYFVERIAGDRFNVHVLTPPGASPETYEPTPTQMKTLVGSVIYFKNGFLMFEDHLAEKLEASISAEIVDLSQGIDLIAADIVDHGDHVHMYGIDPHYWLSTPEVKIVAFTILKALVDIDSTNETEYQKNYNEFIDDIEKLDYHINKMLKDSKIRTFFIYHPAFAYFARQYDLKQIALEMDGKEPTASHMKTIIDLARNEDINTVLVQSQFNKTAAEIIANEIDGEVVLVDPLPENWLENMYEITMVFHKALNP